MIQKDRLRVLFREAYGDEGRIECFFAPGRVNMIGEYTDFNGGYVFPAAISLGISAALRFRDDLTIHLKSMNADNFATVDLTQPILHTAQDGWANYPKGVIKYLLQEGLPLRGCDIFYAGDLPDGAGLSSSASILVLSAYMLRYVHGQRETQGPKLALFARKVENDFMGVQCGIMDQFAVTMGKKGCAILLNCETLQYQYSQLALGKYGLVIMNTNKKRALTDSKYNERRSENDQVVNLIRQHHDVTNLCQITLADLEHYVDSALLIKRARHAITENNRVLQAVELLKQADIAGFGRLMNASHLSLKNDYEVTGKELDSIVAHAWNTDGCIGARMTGAGFGGCAIALVEMEKIHAFTKKVAAGYTQDIGRMPIFYVSSISNGVHVL